MKEAGRKVIRLPYWPGTRGKPHVEHLVLRLGSWRARMEGNGLFGQAVGPLGDGGNGCLTEPPETRAQTLSQAQRRLGSLRYPAQRGLDSWRCEGEKPRTGLYPDKTLGMGCFGLTSVRSTRGVALSCIRLRLRKVDLFPLGFAWAGLQSKIAGRVPPLPRP